jgi:flagellar basal-body rod modification protein FlgD
MLTDPTLLSRLNPAETGEKSSLSQLGEDYESFLQLLTAQITNQDPLSPVDSTEFVAQLAQLSQVEQAVNTNDKLDTMTSQMGGLMNLGGIHLLGRYVLVQSDNIEITEGEGQSFYTLEGQAAEVTAEIADPTGFVVRRLDGLPTGPGAQHSLGWDGLDMSGNRVLDGRYTVRIKAVDADGNAIEASHWRSDIVKDVRFHEGEIRFGLDGGEEVSSVQVSSAG